MKSQRLKFENPQENHYMTVMDFYSKSFTRKSETLTFPYSGAGRIFKRYAASTLFTKMSLPTAMHRLSCWHLTSWGRNVLPCISCSFLLFAQGQAAKQTQCRNALSKCQARQTGGCRESDISRSCGKWNRTCSKVKGSMMVNASQCYPSSLPPMWKMGPSTGVITFMGERVNR